MLIDCHVHLNRYHKDEPAPTTDHCRGLLDKLNEVGIEHAVILTSYTMNCDRPGVQDVLELLHGEPRASVVEGLRWSGDERTDLGLMEERLKGGVIQGIKLYPGYDKYAIDDPSLAPVMRLAGKYDVPVMIHTGDTYAKGAKVRQAHPLLVDDIAVDHPDVKFVLCHLGNPWFVDAGEVLYKNDNVFADISGLTLGDFAAGFEQLMLERVQELIAYLGDARTQLMYGSDWPLVNMPSYVDFFDALPFSDETREFVAWRTAARLFKIDVEASARAAHATAGFTPRPPTKRTGMTGTT